MLLVQSRLVNDLALGVVVASIHSTCRGQALPDSQFSTKDHVGQIGVNRYYTPANQILTPVGIQVELPGMRPQAIALSPNGRLLVTAGKTHYLVVIDRVPGLGTRAAYVKQTLRDKLIDHKPYIRKYGQDVPEIRNWHWGQT